VPNPCTVPKSLTPFPSSQCLVSFPSPAHLVRSLPPGVSFPSPAHLVRSLPPRTGLSRQCSCLIHFPLLSPHRWLPLQTCKSNHTEPLLKALTALHPGQEPHPPGEEMQCPKAPSLILHLIHTGLCPKHPDTHPSVSVSDMSTLIIHSLASTRSSPQICKHRAFLFWALILGPEHRLVAIPIQSWPCCPFPKSNPVQCISWGTLRPSPEPGLDNPPPFFTSLTPSTPKVKLSGGRRAGVMAWMKHSPKPSCLFLEVLPTRPCTPALTFLTACRSFRYRTSGGSHNRKAFVPIELDRPTS
jgi:hypothetical protein